MQRHYLGSVKKLALLIVSGTVAAGALASDDDYLWGEPDRLPDRSGATIRATQAAQSRQLDSIDQHLNRLRQEDRIREDFWGSVQGFSGKKDRSSSRDGFDLDGYSINFGSSWQYGFNQIMGASFSYTQQDAKTSQLGSKYDITNYNASIYSLWDMTSYYVTGAISAGTTTYDARRSITSTDVAGDFTDADYQGYQVAIRAAVGKDFEFNGIHVQPRIAGELNHMTVNSYKEHSDGSDVSLGYRQQTIEQIKLGVGATAFRNYDFRNGVLQPTLSFMAWNDFNNGNEKVEFYALNYEDTVHGTIRSMDGSSSYTVNVDASLSYNSDSGLNIEGGVGHIVQEKSNTTALYLKAAYIF